MPTPARPLTAALAVATLAIAPAGATAKSSYSTPKTGKWKVESLFDDTAGGSAEVYKKGTRMRNLKMTLGEGLDSACEGLSGELKVTRILKIPRVGSYKRPAVGRLSKKTKLIEPISTRVKVNGTSQKATIIIIFEASGRLATTARIKVNDCQISFVLRK